MQAAESEGVEDTLDDRHGSHIINIDETATVFKRYAEESTHSVAQARCAAGYLQEHTLQTLQMNAIQDVDEKKTPADEYC